MIFQHSELLTTSREASLLFDVFQGISATISLASNSDKHLFFSPIIQSGKAAESELVTSNMRLVWHIAKKYFNRSSLAPDDLIQEGVIGLLHAIRTFDPEKADKLSTHASYWIREKIGRSIENQDKAIRIPSYMIELMNKYKTVFAQTENPTFDSVCNTLQISPRQRKLLKKALMNNTMPIVQNSEGQDHDFSDGSTSVLDNLVQSEQLLSIRRKVNTMDERMKFILIKRLDLNNEGVWTLEQIGNELDLTKERVRQLEKQAIKMLRDD